MANHIHIEEECRFFITSFFGKHFREISLSSIVLFKLKIQTIVAKCIAFVFILFVLFSMGCTWHKNWTWFGKNFIVKNSKEFSGEIFCLMLRKIFHILYNRVSLNLSLR